MQTTFQYDVFLSYSSNDRERVLVIAKLLEGEGLQVWLDEWTNNPGTRFMSKRVTALRNARALVLMMSEHFLELHWPILEASTASFRDPANQYKRFIPFLLEKCEIPESIRGYKCFENVEQVQEDYRSLLDACARLTPQKKAEEQPHIADLKAEFPSRTDWIVWCLLPMANGRQLLAGGKDNSVILWDVERTWEVATFRGHKRSVTSVAVTSDGEHFVSGSFDSTVRLWNVRSRECYADYTDKKPISNKQ